MHPKARVRGSVLYLPVTPQFLQVCAPLECAPVKMSFPDSPIPAWIPVPHTPGHTMVVNRIARSSIPGPAMLWKYPGFRDPYFHQRETVDFLTQNNRCFCLNDMGSGKTASVLWATEYLRSIGQVKRTLVLSPLSTLRVVWVADLFQVDPGQRMDVAHGSKKKRQDALYGDAPYVVSNHDMLRLEDPKQIAAHFDHIVVDELGIFRTWQSGGMPQRYRSLLTLAHHPDVKRFWGLTGTPTPNGPFDAWALVKLINPAFTTPKERFRMQVMNQVSEYRWIPKPGAQELVSKLMQPAIRFAKEDVLKFLPPLVFTDREVALSKEQTALRKKIRADLAAEFKGKDITAANAAVMLSKSLQISAGSVLDEDSEAHDIPMSARVNELAELVRETQGKTLVFSSFTAVTKRLVKELKSKKITAAAIHGGVSAGARTKIYEDFQTKDSPQVIVAHPATTAHGITLTAADLIVWFGPTFSAEQYEQANARAHRPGQKRTVTVVRMWSTPEEAAVFRVLKERGDMQNTLLQLARDMK